MKIFDVTRTSYEDNSYWVHYEIDGKIGYEIIETKPILEEACSPYLASIIKDCLQSENEMWFVEFDDEEFDELNQDENFLPNLELEVKKLGLDDYIKFGEDECHITVYGGVITKFLF